jgi:hypothetical protein
MSLLFFRSYTWIYGALQIHYEISPSVSRERERETQAGSGKHNTIYGAKLKK